MSKRERVLHGLLRGLLGSRAGRRGRSTPDWYPVDGARSREPYARRGGLPPLRAADLGALYNARGEGFLEGKGHARRLAHAPFAARCFAGGGGEGGDRGRGRGRGQRWDGRG